ncbi:maltose 6'-phosphate phosphatase [Pelagirhabdus alkalitolerans]|uniref:Maltose 6'-phosphate phosphatase n=1 Tax=Pelagirhabdus alkalitolerans TaxID=1612202 RepID=A0A1G6L023_9BACI|nr:endonuclease/exonuclease/phosphatase family protein [Pelagirhabdus alkalitolerans]SDC36709.1 maltose 6'-phosphate phosphatase [Pelagirhabdus alkalitolerans]
MKLLTLNAHSWQETHQLDKITILADEIVQKGYDVIALQEVSQLIDSLPLNDSLIHDDHYGQLLVDQLNKKSASTYHMRWAQAHIGYDIYEEGVALITRLPIIDEDVIFLSDSQDVNDWKTRVALKLTIESNQKLIDVFSVHLGFWEDKDEPAAKQFKRLLDATNLERLTFLMGDFNTESTHQSEGYRFMLNHNWLDTYTLAKEKDNGITVPGAIDGWKDSAKDKRIDYIFTNQTINVDSSFAIFNGQNKPVISDHYGVEVELIIPN